MAPEVILRQGYGMPSDIWSLGCTVLQMITGMPPWKQLGFRSTEALLRHIATCNTPPPYPHNADPSLISFLDACFHRDVNKRATAEELLLHEFVLHSGGYVLSC